MKFGVFILAIIISCQPKTAPKISIENDQFGYIATLSTERYIESITLTRDSAIVQHIPIQKRISQYRFSDLNLRSGNYNLVVNGKTFETLIPFYHLKKTNSGIHIHLPAGGMNYPINEIPSNYYLLKSDTLRFGLSAFERRESFINVYVEVDSMKYHYEFGRSFNEFIEFKHPIQSESATLTISIPELNIITQSTLLYVNPTVLKSKIDITDILIPVEIDGSQYSFLDNLSLYVPDQTIEKIERFFSSQLWNAEETAPFTFSSHTISNYLDQELIIYTQLRIFNQNNEIEPAFIPVNWKENGLPKFSTSSIYLKKNQSSVMLTPVFIKYDSLLAGNYKIQNDFYILGESEPFYTSTKNLTVHREQNTLLAFYLIISLISIIYLIRFVWTISDTFKQLKIEVIVTISIFAALHFGFNFVAQLIDSSVLAILGPFRVFISNFFTECISYMIIISLYMLYPKRGVIGVKLLLSFLISLVLTGGGVLLTIINTGIMILLIETVLNRFSTRANLIQFSLLGLVDASVAFIQFVEMKLLYRLMYADWYIITMMIVIGFLYTVIGCYIGRYLGRNLKKVLLT
jgi:hypothetical protein